MQRITISLDEALAATFDTMITERAYLSRSEAVRDLVRDAIEGWRAESGTVTHCVANISYVYDRRVRALAEKLSAIEHEHHDLVASSNTLRLNHFHSLVSTMLKGPTDAVRDLLALISAQRGVQSAKVNMLAVHLDDDHDHDAAHDHLGGGHFSPID